MASPFETLLLKDQKPVATGYSRLVYQHPRDRRFLVKVINSSVLERRRNKERNWFQKRRKFQGYVDFVREIVEYICVRSQTEQPIPSIQRIVGIVDTDMGLGMVVERVTARNDETAPVLASLLRRDGFTPEIERMLETLIDDLNRNHVVLSELVVRNIVCAENDNNERQLVLIDGYGDKVLIPLYSFSKVANRWRNRRKYRQLIAEAKKIAAECTWPQRHC